MGRKCLSPFQKNLEIFILKNAVRSNKRGSWDEIIMDWLKGNFRLDVCSTSTRKLYLICYFQSPVVQITDTYPADKMCQFQYILSAP